MNIFSAVFKMYLFVKGFFVLAFRRKSLLSVFSLKLNRFFINHIGCCFGNLIWVVVAFVMVLLTRCHYAFFIHLNLVPINTTSVDLQSCLTIIEADWKMLLLHMKKKMAYMENLFWFCGWLYFWRNKFSILSKLTLNTPSYLPSSRQ